MRWAAQQARRRELKVRCINITLDFKKSDAEQCHTNESALHALLQPAAAPQPPTAHTSLLFRCVGVVRVCLCVTFAMPIIYETGVKLENGLARI